MDIELGIVQINVTNLAHAWDFYINTLEFAGEQTLGENHPFTILAVPTRILVYPVQSVSERAYPEGTGVLLVFYTPDIVRTVEQWRSRGVRLIPARWARGPHQLADTPFGPFIAFSDPFGNVHELLQPHSRTSTNDSSIRA